MKGLLGEGWVCQLPQCLGLSPLGVCSFFLSTASLGQQRKKGQKYKRLLLSFRFPLVIPKSEERDWRMWQWNSAGQGLPRCSAQRRTTMSRARVLQKVLIEVNRADSVTVWSTWEVPQAWLWVQVGSTFSCSTLCPVSEESLTGRG